jgi:hypothetical protein
MTARHSLPEPSEPETADSMGYPKLNSMEPERRIWDALELHPQMIGFTPAATCWLISITDEQTARLGVEAVAIANNRGATAVDIPDIKAADNELNNRELATQISAWLLTVGSILFGAALSTLVVLLLRTAPLSHPAVWWVATVTAAVVGLVLLVVSFPRKK